jgi:hypothetical protein
VNITITLPLPPKELSPNYTVGSRGQRMGKAAKTKKYRWNARTSTVIETAGKRGMSYLGSLRIACNRLFYAVLIYPKEIVQIDCWAVSAIPQDLIGIKYVSKPVRDVSIASTS